VAQARLESHYFVSSKSVYDFPVVSSGGWPTVAVLHDYETYRPNRYALNLNVDGILEFLYRDMIINLCFVSEILISICCFVGEQINGGFFEDDQLLQGVQKMRHIPGIIVQGRYDFVCPIAVSDLFLSMTC
jgi:hypothetical protein